jgi:GTP cyclohydrolase II
MSSFHHIHSSDLALLDILTATPTPSPKAASSKRDSALDPLLLAAVAASGPNITRNHYHHDFFPGVMMPQAEGSWDWTKWTGDDAATKKERNRITYVSRQAPRSVRLSEEGKENGYRFPEHFKSTSNLPSTPQKRWSSLLASAVEAKMMPESLAPPPHLHSPEILVKCMARTRIPTPHGPAFLHLYHNNRDNKEHLAIVIDPAQFNESGSLACAPPIRSRSLDAVWGESETEMDRITRGAYVGRLTSISRVASTPSLPHKPAGPVPLPTIRVHSECFTGETIGSMRCDCGEQLEEALRVISRSITLPPTLSSPKPRTIPGRGAVIYLRQEGRGIGLLEKIRAYNLQDLGYDTVAANLKLGHEADERGYEIAGAILRDLGLCGDEGEGVKLLTNNPDKVKALEKEGVRIVERIGMVPKSWHQKTKQSDATSMTVRSSVSNGWSPLPKRVEEKGYQKAVGSMVHGEDLDKYLKTKVLKMGHMLPLWLEEEPIEI